MRQRPNRVVHVAIVAALLLPMLPPDLLGGSGTAQAQGQGPNLGGVLPAGIAWQDWQAAHVLHARRSATTCQPDQGSPTGNAPLPGDRRCTIPMNATTDLAFGVPAVTERAVEDSPNAQAVADTKKVFMRLEPSLQHDIRVNGMKAKFFMVFTPTTPTCGGVPGATNTGRVIVRVSVVKIAASDPLGEGQLIGTGLYDKCPFDEPTNDVAAYPIDVPIQMVNQEEPVLAGEKIQLNVSVQRLIPNAGTWKLLWDAQTSPTHLELSSPDAVQFAAWTEFFSLSEQQGKPTNIFPVPVNPADRFSAAGFFAFKSAFGGYDNPEARNESDTSRSAKWAMSLRAPGGQLLDLQKHDLVGDVAGTHEFRDCDNNSNDKKACLVFARAGGVDNAGGGPTAKVWRLPSRPIAPGSAPVWNYTRGEVEALGGGGLFKFVLDGSHRGLFIGTRLSEAGGLPFVVGGAGVRLQALKSANFQEQLVHQLCARQAAPNEPCQPGQGTTFLLDVTNIGPRADNFTLTGTVLAASPPEQKNNWRVAFAGPNVNGPDRASVQGFNQSLLKVTVTPPAGLLSGSATVRVEARSQNAPDQFAQVDLTAQLSSTLTRGAGVFLFPDAPEKPVRRGDKETFNFTIWNRGTDRDSFSVSCDQGPDHTFDAQTLRRNDDAWNGTVRLGGLSQLCREIDPGKVLTITVPPGDTREAQVTVEASANATSRPQMKVVLKVASQGDAGKTDLAEATARLSLRSSFKLQILTEGFGNPEDPFDVVSASRTLRLGKDDPNFCPNPANPNPSLQCSGGEQDELPPSHFGDFGDFPVQTQRLDTNFTEFAYYRIVIQNDGDVADTYSVGISKIVNSTLNLNCNGGTGDTFTAVRLPKSGGVGMNDLHGVALLRSPSTEGGKSFDLWGADLGAEHPNRIGLVDPDNVGLQPGKNAVFYLRVHNEWNRYNLSVLYAGAGGGATPTSEGEVCESRSVVTVDVVTNHPDGSPIANVRKSVEATTFSRNRELTHPFLAKNVVITQGQRLGNSIYDADQRQTCPPVTAPNSPDRLFCKYVKPGATQDWFLTVSKVSPIGDHFVVKPLRRVGGLSLTDLVNRGWVISAPCIYVNEQKCDPIGAATPISNLSGDEITLRVRVTVPLNATIFDFAGLEAEVQLLKSAASAKFAFFTVGAQKFKVGLTRLTPEVADIHPGDRAAIVLNLSNEGAGVDRYSVIVNPPLPTGWNWDTPNNGTSVSPSRNKTITVFVQSPTAGQFPQTVTGVIRVRSLENLSEIPGETVAEVPFTVVAKPRGLEDLNLTVWNVQGNAPGTPVRQIQPGGGLTFTLRVHNPAPNEKVVALRRLPDQALLPEFVKGWQDIVGESCLVLPARDVKLVSFTVQAAPDTLDGTAVTYVLRADEAQGTAASCTVPANSQNFAQALVTASVIGISGLQLEPQPGARITSPDGSSHFAFGAVGSAVVPRGGTVSFPVRVRNIGTGNDTFFFQASLVNQSQAISSTPWVINAPQSMLVDPQFNPIVFVNVTVPVNVPQTEVRSDLDLVVRGTRVDPQSVRLTVFVQDYDIRLRIQNNTLDAIPGQTLYFVLNLTNQGNGIDIHDIQVDIGGLAGYWNVSSEFSAVTLLNQTSKDIQLGVQVPKAPLPTTGAVIGITVRSRQVEAIRATAEQTLGAGSPLLSYMNSVPRTALVTVNLYPYVSLDVDGDRDPELAVDRNRNPLDGFEAFVDPFTGVIQAVSLLSADGDGDGRIDHFIDTNLDGRPERYWDPDNARLTAMSHYPDLNNDGTLEYVFDSDADLAVDRWVDPATRLAGDAVQRDFDGDGNPEYLIDTTGDGRYDKYFDPDPNHGPRGLVTTVEGAPSGNLQQFAIDTSGGGRPTRIYDRVTGEVTDARVQGVVEFAATYWYLVLLFLAVAVLAGYLVVQRRRQGGGGEGNAPPPR